MFFFATFHKQSGFIFHFRHIGFINYWQPSTTPAIFFYSCSCIHTYSFHIAFYIFNSTCKRYKRQTFFSVWTTYKKLFYLYFLWKKIIFFLHSCVDSKWNNWIIIICPFLNGNTNLLSFLFVIHDNNFFYTFEVILKKKYFLLTGRFIKN